MSNVAKRVVRKKWGFEIWTTITDEKGKIISDKQTGAAVHGPDDADFKRMLALVDPFARAG